jgi:hypothetical protein
VTTGTTARKINRYWAKLSIPPSLFGLQRRERPTIVRKTNIAMPVFLDREYGKRPVRRTNDIETKRKMKSAGLRLMPPIVKNQSGDNSAATTTLPASILVGRSEEWKKTPKAILHLVVGSVHYGVY